VPTSVTPRTIAFPPFRLDLVAGRQELARRRVAATGTWADEVPLGTDIVESIGLVLDRRIKLAVGADGSAVAAGIEWTGSGSESSWARRYTPDTSSTNWGGPVTIGTNIGQATVGAGIDAAGNALVASRVNDDNGLRFRRYVPGTGWDVTSGNIPFFADRFDEQRLLTMGVNGPAVAVAEDEDPPGLFYPVGDLLAVRFD
jgi:hypothetical protein